MIRTMTTAILAAFVLGGMALAQSPDPPGARPHDPPATVPPNFQSPPPPPPFVPDTPPAPDDNGLWGSVSALVGWTKGDMPPALVTTSPAGTPRATAGILPSPSTTVLFGGTNLNQKARYGADLELGYWLDCQHEAGIEGGFFFLGGASTGYFATSDGSLILARPFRNVTIPAPASSLIAFPGLSSGSIQISENSRQVWSGHLDFTESWCCGKWWRLESLLGYRYFRFDERLQIDQLVTSIGGPFVPGTTIRSTDYFATGNIFHGVDLGLRATFLFDNFTVELLGKVPAGYLTRNLSINGQQVVTVPGFAPVTNGGGLLALASNIGVHNGHTLTALPEVGTIVSWKINRYLRLQAGYNVMWLLRMYRPGALIDTGINPTQIPPGVPVLSGQLARPNVANDARDMWVQTLSLGLEFRY
jgi:hypothetical protein